MKAFIIISLLTTLLFSNECYKYLQKADENIQKMEKSNFTTHLSASANKAITYMLRYNICIESNEKKDLSKKGNSDEHRRKE